MSSPATNPAQIQPKLKDVTESQPPLATARLRVDLGALQANYRELIRRASPAALAPVVKADGYGLGAVEVVRRLAASGADTFFVARLEEGIALRSHFPRARIFILDGLIDGAGSAYVTHLLTPVLNTLEEIAEWGSYARRERTALNAALQIDTGMNRSGLSQDDVSKLAADTRNALSGINVALIMSHLACADDPKHALNRRQLERFLAALDMLPPAPASLAATAGIELGHDYLFDIVRPGLGLYGGNPQPGRTNPYRMVAHLKGRVIQLRHVPKGETVGYGAAFTAARDSKIAIVPLGYADGLIRAMGPHGYAAIDGVRVPFAGRISMDLVALDVTEIDDGKCERGTEAEFLGETISLEDAAFAAGTINHEVLTSLTPRAVRVYEE